LRGRLSALIPRLSCSSALSGQERVQAGDPSVAHERHVDAADRGDELPPALGTALLLPRSVAPPNTTMLTPITTTTAPSSPTQEVTDR
jgi:hypothetical protein